MHSWVLLQIMHRCWLLGLIWLLRRWKVSDYVIPTLIVRYCTLLGCLTNAALAATFGWSLAWWKTQHLFFCLQIAAIMAALGWNIPLFYYRDPRELVIRLLAERS